MEASLSSTTVEYVVPRREEGDYCPVRDCSQNSTYLSSIHTKISSLGADNWSSEELKQLSLNSGMSNMI